VLRIDPKSGETRKVAQLNGSPGQLLYADRALWIVGGSGPGTGPPGSHDFLLEVGPTTGRTTRISSIANPDHLTWGGGRVWAISSGSQTLSGFEPSARSVEARKLRPGVLTAIAAGSDAVRVTLLVTRSGAPVQTTILKLNPRHLSIERRLVVNRQVSSISTAGRGNVAWISDFTSVSRVSSAGTDALRLRSAKLRGTGQLVTMDGAVWVTRSGGRVSRLDPLSLRVTRTLRVGRSADALAILGGRIAVYDSDSQALVVRSLAG
jgi:hypothetical protein